MKKKIHKAVTAKKGFDITYPITFFMLKHVIRKETKKITHTNKKKNNNKKKQKKKIKKKSCINIYSLFNSFYKLVQF